MKPPIAHRLACALLAEMASGSYHAGDRFLSHRKIMNHWNVSNTTTLKSFELLVQWGVLVARDRSGYYHTENFRERALLQLNQLENSSSTSLPSQPRWLTRVNSSMHGKTPLRNIAVIVIYNKAPSGSMKSSAATKALGSINAKTIRSIYNDATANNVFINFFASSENDDDSLSLVDNITRSGAQGVIIIRRMFKSPMIPIKNLLQAKRIPVVTVFDDCKHEHGVSINFNNVGMGHRAVTSFLERGHKNITLLTHNAHNNYFADRIEGCKLAAAKHPRSNLHTILMNDNSKSTAPIVETLLQNKTTAIFAASEELFTRLAPNLKLKDIRVPDDLSVVVCSTETHETQLNRNIDYICLDFEDIGKQAFEALLKSYNGDIPHRLILLNPTLESKGSVTTLTQSTT